MKYLMSALRRKTLTPALQALSHHIALTATPQQAAHGISYRKPQQPSAPAQPHRRPQKDGQSDAQIEREVQQVIQSVLGAAVASHLPLMQVSASSSLSNQIVEVPWA